MKQAKAVPQTLKDDIQVAKDNLLLSKVTQAAHKNKHQSAEIWYNVGDKVMLLTFHHHHEYIQKGKNHVAKSMPWFDGPYIITKAYPLCSVYTIDMPNSPSYYFTFHTICWNCLSQQSQPVSFENPTEPGNCGEW